MSGVFLVLLFLDLFANAKESLKNIEDVSDLVSPRKP